MPATRLARRIDAALGKTPCDTVIKGGQFLDVFSCRWRRADIGIADGYIVAVDEGISGRETVLAKDLWIVPGFLDAHVHVESSLVIPARFQEMVLPRGTTTAICDPHELTNVLGTQALAYFLDESTKLSLDLRVMLSSCVPATHMETNGAGILSAADLLPFKHHPQALGLAEMMNVPGVFFQTPEVIAKLDAFSDVPQDGHCPLLKGRELSAYASTGISSCHESSQLEEAREKLTKGLAVWIREGSVAKDLKTLIPLLDAGSAPHIGFCTDDRNPLDIASEGHIDHLIREALRHGIASEVVYRSASHSVAQHYGLDRGASRRGAIAPGYLADLVLLDDAQTCAIHQVMKTGIWANRVLAPSSSFPFSNSIQASVPELSDLKAPTGRVHVIGVEPGKILTTRTVTNHDALGVHQLSVLERYGHGSPPSNGYVFGFGENLRGAIASSVGHDSHNLIAVGSNPKEIQTAFSALIKSAGGFVVVQNGVVIAELALPFGGLMTTQSPKEVERALLRLREASRRIGCELPEPFLQLAFLSLPVIPSLKLTDKGLVDVEKFQIISVSAA